MSQLLVFGQETRKIDGQRYTVHIVEKGHTLFAISKKYSVEIDRILEHNAEAKKGLKIGDEILVPMSEVDKKAARDNPPEISGEYLTHTVEKKETLYSISKKYNVDINSILEQNPEADKGLSIGQELRILVGDIPVKDTASVAPAKDDSLILHKVEPGQTVYSLTKMYEVSADSIRQLNDGLKEGLKAGTYVRIPKYTPAYLASHPAVEDTTVLKPMLTGNRDTYRVALMLPFSMDIQDSLFRQSNPTDPIELYTLTRIAVEIYRGVLLAADSLKSQGLNVELHVYDVADDMDELSKLLKNPELEKMHLIIGPLHRTSYERVSEFAAPLGIHVVSPVPNQMLKPTTPNSCVVHPNAIAQMKFIGRYVARMHYGDNIVLVDSDKFKDYDYVQAFLGSFQDNFRISDTLNILKLDKFGIETIKNNLSENRKNIVVVPSSDLGFVSDFMNRLSNLNEKEYDIQVIGMEKWLDYHNVDIAYKNRFGLIVPSSTYLDYEGEMAREFLKTYRKMFNQETGSDGYAFLGFDIGLYLMKGLLKDGLDLRKYFSGNNYRGLHLGFEFEQTNTGCFNRHIFLLQFRDYHLEKIN